MGVDSTENITAVMSGIDTIKSLTHRTCSSSCGGKQNFNRGLYAEKVINRSVYAVCIYLCRGRLLKQSNLEIEPERTGIVMGI